MCFLIKLASYLIFPNHQLVLNKKLMQRPSQPSSNNVGEGIAQNLLDVGQIDKSDVDRVVEESPNRRYAKVSSALLSNPYMKDESSSRQGSV